MHIPTYHNAPTLASDLLDFEIKMIVLGGTQHRPDQPGLLLRQLACRFANGTAENKVLFKSVCF